MALEFLEPLEELQTAASDKENSEQQQDSPQIEGIALDPLAGRNGGDEGRRLAKFWLDQIKAIDEVQKKWVKRSEKIIKRYRDERSPHEESIGQRRFNSLWCNVQILQPNLYSKPPLPIAERRFRDRDPTGRAGAQILERCLRN